MKETGPLNREISEVLAKMGHRDQLCVTDAGLAIPDEVRCIDLSIKHNLPRYFDVLDMILEHFSVEKIIVAEETKATSPTFFKEVCSRFSEDVEVELIPHAEFLGRRTGVKAMVRTGEFTAYGNVILVSGADLNKWYIEKE